MNLLETANVKTFVITNIVDECIFNKFFTYSLSQIKPVFFPGILRGIAKKSEKLKLYRYNCFLGTYVLCLLYKSENMKSFNFALYL